MSIKGYTSLNSTQQLRMNRFKEWEERILRIVDNLAEDEAIDQRSLSLARTNFQQAFMWANRSIAKPERIDLPEDNETI